MGEEPTYNGELRTPPRFYKTWKLASNPAQLIDELFSQFGDFLHYRGVVNLYLVNHPALVKQVLNETHRNFDKQTVIYDRFRNALGNGLVNAEGDHWKRQRKLLQPVFRSGSVKSFFDIMLRSTEKMADAWERRITAGTIFRVHGEIANLTLEIAGKALFSNGFEESADDIIHWTNTINTYSSFPPLRILNNTAIPTPLNLRLKHVLREYNTFITGMIEQRLADPSHDDLLSIFLTMRDEDTGEPMKMHEVAEEVLGMIIGGHETSSAALVSTFFELSRHPEIERQVVDEIDRVKGDGPLLLEHLEELHLTRRVIDESMRLHPPFWFENRNAKEDTDIGGTIVPKGSMIALSRYSLHRNPVFWDDPETFNPERFNSDSPDYIDSDSMGIYIPFSRGPRSCVGRHFAMMEMMIIVTTLLSRYQFQPTEIDKDDFSARLALELKNRFPVRIIRRAKRPTLTAV